MVDLASYSLIYQILFPIKEDANSVLFFHSKGVFAVFSHAFSVSYKAIGY